MKTSMKIHKTIFVLVATIAMVFVSGVQISQSRDWKDMEPEFSPEARFGHSLVTLPDGNVVMFGGEAEDHRLFNDLHFFGDDWRAVEPANDPPSARKFHKAWVVGDQVYIHGGQSLTELLDDLWRYDTNSNTWTDITPSGPRPSARFAHSSAQLSDGGTLIFAGNDGQGDQLDLWHYDPGSNQFNELQECNLTYAYHTAHIFDNFMFVLGRPNTIVAYDMQLGAWRYIPQGPPTSGRSVSAAWINPSDQNMISIFGGLDADGQESAAVYEMNVATGEIIERAEPMPFPVIDSDAAPLPSSMTPENTSTQKVSTDISASSEPSSLFIPLVFFGGSSSGQAINNTFLFNRTEKSAVLPGVLMLLLEDE